MVRERDGAAGRPLQDALDPEDQPALEAICQSLEGKTEKQKNPHPKGSLAYASGCARDLADGPVTTANQDPL